MVEGGEGISQRTCVNDHRHGRWCGDGLWEWGMGQEGESKGENWDICNRITINFFLLQELL